MLDCFSDYSKRLQLEKLVIGLEEPIFIDGIGEFIAKVDSGNGGFNVIHGEDVYQNGGVLVFKTFDKNNELKQVSKKLLQFINVNIGSGKVEQRPVIELNVKFGDEEYQKVPFSVANRSSNSHKVLICKNFIQHQLNALIDVGEKMLSDKGVEVEYITEADAATYGAGVDPEVLQAIGKKVKKAGKAIASAPGKAMNAAQNDWEQTKADAESGPLHRKIPANIAVGGAKLAKGAAGLGVKALKETAGAVKDVVTTPFKQFAQDIKNQGGLLRSILGGLQGVGKFTDAPILDELKGDAKEAADYEDLYALDRKLILRKTKESNNNILIFKLIDYQGKYYAGKKPIDAEIKNFEIYKKGNKKIAQAKLDQQKAEEKPKETTGGTATGTSAPEKTSGATMQTQSFEYKLANLILEANEQDAKNIEGNVTAPEKTTPETPKPTAPDAPTTSPDPEVAQYQKIADLYEKNRKFFYVYFVEAAENIKSKTSVYDREVKKLNTANRFTTIVNNFFKTIGMRKLTFSQETGNVEINDKFINSLDYLLRGENSSQVANRFAICFGGLDNRKIYIIGTEEESELSQFEEVGDLYAVFNKKERDVLSEYEELLYGWKKNLYLKYQKMDLSNQGVLLDLQKALKERRSELNESVENNKIDLHLDEVKKEGAKPGEERNQLDVGIEYVRKALVMIKNHNMQGMSEQNWKRMIKFTYVPDLDQLSKGGVQEQSTDEKSETEEQKAERSEEQTQEETPGDENTANEESAQDEEKQEETPEEPTGEEEKAVEETQQQKEWKNNPILSNVLEYVPFEELSEDDFNVLEEMIQNAINTYEEQEEELVESLENLTNSAKSRIEKALKEADLKTLQQTLQLVQSARDGGGKRTPEDGLQKTDEQDSESTGDETKDETPSDEQEAEDSTKTDIQTDDESTDEELGDEESDDETEEPYTDEDWKRDKADIDDIIQRNIRDYDKISDEESKKINSSFNTFSREDFYQLNEAIKRSEIKSVNDLKRYIDKKSSISFLKNYFANMGEEFDGFL